MTDRDAGDRVEASYDATGLRALQDELRRLNAAARADGLFGDKPSAEPPAPGETTPKARKGARKRGKAAARRLLDVAGRLEDDDSPDVPGTRFTEAGVVRLLARLRRRRERDGAWPRFLGRVRRALGRPVPDGQHLVAGVGLARLQIACRQILEIEMHGLAHLATRRAIRRGRVLQAEALKLGDEAAPSRTAPPEASSSKASSTKASSSRVSSSRVSKSSSSRASPAEPSRSKQGGSR